MRNQAPKFSVEAREVARIGRTLLAVAPFVVFFFVLLAMTIPHGLTSLVTGYNIPASTDSVGARTIFGWSDAGSSLSAAMSLRANAGITQDAVGIYNFWPPGMIAVDRVLLSVEAHLHIPIVLSMVLLNCAVWAIFLGVVFTLIRSIVSLRVALLFACGFFLYSGLNLWGISVGLFYSDCFGAIAYCYCLLFLLMVVRAQTTRSRITFAVLSGVSLALACYFRASFELVADATLLVALVLCLALAIAAVVSRRTARHARLSSLWRGTVMPLTVMSIATQLTILPWRIFAGIKIHPGDFRWSTVSDYASVERWVPSSVLLARPGSFFKVLGHSNWACLSAPVECAKIESLEKFTTTPYDPGQIVPFSPSQFDHLTIKAILAHPLNFITERLYALALGFANGTGPRLHTLALPESIILVVLALAIAILFIRSRSFTNPLYLFFFFATAIQFLTIAAIHMESRYFIAIEMSIIVLASFALVDPRLRRRWRDRDQLETLAAKNE